MSFMTMGGMLGSIRCSVGFSWPGFAYYPWAGRPLLACAELHVKLQQ